MDQTLHIVATKKREEIKGTTKQKMARQHNKEGGNHLGQDSNRQRTIEGIDGELHPAVDGHSLDEMWNHNYNTGIFIQHLLHGSWHYIETWKKDGNMCIIYIVIKAQYKSITKQS